MNQAPNHNQPPNPGQLPHPHQADIDFFAAEDAWHKEEAEHKENFQRTIGAVTLGRLGIDVSPIAPDAPEPPRYATERMREKRIDKRIAKHDELQKEYTSLKASYGESGRVKKTRTGLRRLGMIRGARKAYKEGTMTAAQKRTVITAARTPRKTAVLAEGPTVKKARKELEHSEKKLEKIGNWSLKKAAKINREIARMPATANTPAASPNTTPVPANVAANPNIPPPPPHTLYHQLQNLGAPTGNVAPRAPTVVDPILNALQLTVWENLVEPDRVEELKRVIDERVAKELPKIHLEAIHNRIPYNRLEAESRLRREVANELLTSEFGMTIEEIESGAVPEEIKHKLSAAGLLDKPWAPTIINPPRERAPRGAGLGSESRTKKSTDDEEIDPEELVKRLATAEITALTLGFEPSLFKDLDNDTNKQIRAERIEIRKRMGLAPGADIPSEVNYRMQAEIDGVKIDEFMANHGIPSNKLPEVQLVVDTFFTIRTGKNKFRPQPDDDATTT